MRLVVGSDFGHFLGFFIARILFRHCRRFRTGYFFSMRGEVFVLRGPNDAEQSGCLVFGECGCFWWQWEICSWC